MRDDDIDDVQEESDVTIPVYEEHVRIGKKRVDTQRVRVRKEVVDQPFEAEEVLVKERFDIEHVPKDHFVDEAPGVRREGDVTVIPVVEEVLEVRKRLLLKEEIRITKRTEQVTEPVSAVLKQERVQVDRVELPAEIDPRSTPGQKRRVVMEKTIVGLFDNPLDVQPTVTDLVNLGINRSSIDVMDQKSGLQAYKDEDTSTERGTGMWAGMKRWFEDLGLRDRDSHHFAEAIRRGGCMIAVRTSGENLNEDEIADIFDRHGAVDIDRRAEHYQASGFKEFDESAPAYSQDEMIAERERFAPGGDFKIPVVEEKVSIGKQKVASGKVRIYTRDTATPIDEELRLRDERVEVDRRAVDRPAEPGELNDSFKEGALEFTESTEVPLVNKESRVVEEVSVHKSADEHVEQVHETAHRRDVEVERTKGRNNTTTNRRT